MSSGSILVTGAGTGFGKDIALRLAEENMTVIAAVEIVAQVASLKTEARQRGVNLHVEKLDVTETADRARAANWNISVLVNNAGIAEGGSVVDIPAENLRRQFEVNVFGPILLTQDIARGMIKQGHGRIVFMSSIAGLTADPFTGAYAGSKHALEAFAEALHIELQEFGIQVATINPGAFLTGFNDRMFETWKSWRDDPSRRVFDYSQLAFPHPQLDATTAINVSVDVIRGDSDLYRNPIPTDRAHSIRDQMNAVWQRHQNNANNRARSTVVQQAYDIAPATLADD